MYVAPLAGHVLTQKSTRAQRVNMGIVFRRGLTACASGNTTNVIMAGAAPLDRIRALLSGRQLPIGGWPALSYSSQAALEPTALACIVLGSDSIDPVKNATQFLLSVQNRNGSWPAFVGDDQEGSWTTSLVIIALQRFVEAVPQRTCALQWLIHSAGKESHWLWRWKFLISDRHVRFDPNKFGWPWLPETNSWVVPTAFSILALNQAGSGALQSGKHRIEVGVQMLFDRACPGGGWNAGNGIVYGRAMSPHPDDTAIALLALVRHQNEPFI